MSLHKKTPFGDVFLQKKLVVDVFAWKNFSEYWKHTLF